jgi:outer membrane beta-barrel protein
LKTLVLMTFTLALLPTLGTANAPLPNLKPAEFDAKDVWNTDIFSRDDHKVIVIQERRFTKARRLEVGLTGGRTAMNAFYNSWNAGAQFAYHLSEYFGVEAFANQGFNSDTADADQLDEFLDVSGFTSTKERHKPELFYGVAATWAPIYGKFAFFRTNIIHFDFYGQAGLSVIEAKSNFTKFGGRDQTKLGPLLGVGVRVFFNNTYSLRFDVRNNIYQLYFAPPKSGLESATLWRSNFQFNLGLSALFGKGRND